MSFGALVPIVVRSGTTMGQRAEKITRNKLSGVFALAVETDIIVTNPCHKAKLYPIDNAREKVLGPEEEENLFKVELFRAALQHSKRT